MPLVSITRLHVRSWRYLPPFLIQALRSAWQAKLSEGNLSVSILQDARNTFWTRTVWTDEAAMKSYIIAGVHKQVMRSLLEWCDEAAVVHWEQESSQPPPWEAAFRRLREEGRPSKVNHPSPAHQAYQFPMPQVRMTGELRFK
ncbi:MAG: DUF3291 domain-containing protein [Chloroflexota bacterium]|nr:DUF3291 domain-containing protein [Chloroflexota bacterium]